jgi:hypothetical protein
MAFSFLAAFFLCVLAVPGFATPVHLADDESATIEELIGGMSLTFGDKLFYGWEVVENRSTSSADPLQTIVSSIGADSQNVRLRFDGQENQSLYAEGNELIDFTFRFKVKALDPNFLIDDVGLALRNFDANDIMEITEFAYDPGTSVLNSYASLAVDPSHQTDHDTFDPRREIEVEKHIVFGGGINFETFEPEVSHIGAFGEDFSQVPVPEPQTFSLLAGALGASVLAARRRRRRDVLEKTLVEPL